MIKLVKTAEPQILIDNAAAWTKAVTDRIALGQSVPRAEGARYGHPEIKAALLAETFGKCAYCESKIRHVAPGDIEHILPKSVVHALWFEWVNLTIACGECNRRKSAHLGSDEDFVDPYDVDPEDLFWSLGALMIPAPGSEPALSTLNLLDLNRADLLERRDKRLSGLLRHLDVIKRTASPTARAILVEDFLTEQSGDQEYAALARQVVLLARQKGVL